ncbi:MAG: bifunctional 4-hydroxy-3-methylbut-2-enyl diphosphate reductase/30S ribosomal protein S1 [Clostridia bacterium]|nr:bifunctional 4-hydroxy-3-methylbut-2-enyl diphosphate reductase/30S ribosomal protein S1 [Clostridia bacterium]
MSIEIAKTAGFCYGVKRAVQKTYEAIAEENGKIVTLGHLIHNRGVVSDLEQHGVVSYDNIEDIPSDATVIIRTHGVKKSVIEALNDHKIIDLTCPFVSKIHKIVEENYKNGYKIVIVGDKNHPEVIGINGWCDDDAIITYDETFKMPQEFAEKPICIVAQTTINRNVFVQIVQNIKNTCKKVLVFDTICGATKDRQSEASELSKRSDMMFVIGSRESSNTGKLFKISSENCPETYFIENFEEIPQDLHIKNKKIGITAGASTPARTIEEVFTAMEEKIRNEESFAELFEKYGTKTLNNGDIVDATVVEIRNNEVIVDLGGFKYNGQLAVDQLSDDPYLKASDIVKVGDTIQVYVVGVNDAEGKVVLSRKKVIAMESWNKMKEAFENKTVLEGKIIKAVRGGVIALADDMQIFVPARQASLRFVQNLDMLLGNTVKMRLIEMDERRKRAIGSVRVLLEEEKKAAEDKFWGEAEIGKEYSGVVKSVTSFGAFVDLGGIDGLVHVSELSWNKIKHPSEVVSEGDVLKVYIKDLNPETKKISLGYKKAEDNPWVIAKAKINLGDVVKCKIVRMMPFGAFAEIMPNIDGLIHISQIADRKIGKPEDVLTIGEEVEAKVVALDWDLNKISLSIRALIAPPVEEKKEEEVVEEPVPQEENVPVDIEKFIAEEEKEEVAEEAPVEATEEAPKEEEAPKKTVRRTTKKAEPKEEEPKAEEEPQE